MLQQISSSRSFLGHSQVYQHDAKCTNTDMTFSVYLPDLDAHDDLCPVIYFFSGLTCNHENFIFKSGVQQYLSQHKICLVACDTSPRGDNVPDIKDDMTIGSGAGFYVNATEEPWLKHYQMYDYVAKELPHLIEENFPIDPQRCSLMGHSMGGHGALIVALNHPTQWRSVSAFAPICAPSQCTWGRKAFHSYLGDDPTQWSPYDSVSLVRSGCAAAMSGKILIDQGDADEFLAAQQLRPDLFVEACRAANVAIDFRERPGFDHSYFYISSFIAEHIEFHMHHLTL